MCSCFFFLLIFSHLIGLRCHQAIQFQRCIELILERDNRVTVEQQPLALVAVRHIRQLERRNIQLLGKDLPVAGSLPNLPPRHDMTHSLWSDLRPRTSAVIPPLSVRPQTAVSYTHLDVYKRQDC